MTVVDLKNVTSGRPLDVNGEFDASLNNADLARRNIHLAHFGGHEQGPRLRHNKEVSVGIVHAPVAHRQGGRVHVDSKAGLHFRLSGATQ
eukprot:CAMPEP_0116904458 /NCGR_PEP_ID=MMETSP0467-20121206/11441_1 /TAXON_ID=283647 /ORGANISM="Mesodinium pulex, Strain SPMC105" /LENGTH=89 /DNA_ID=CAMNT_0004579127 /DNA_START=122 /DNA_END=391 /DNA_ORIENTATION=-